MPHGRAAAASLLTLASAASFACASGHVGHELRIDQPGAHRLSGQVLTVDPPSRSLKLLDAGRIYTISYDSETIVRRGSAEVSPDALRSGDRLIVSLRDDRSGEARLIGIAGPAPSVSPPRGVVP